MGVTNPIHITFLLVLVLLVFGAKRLPELGRSLGSGMRGFKESLEGQPTQAEAGELVQAPVPSPTNVPIVTAPPSAGEPTPPVA